MERVLPATLLHIFVVASLLAWHAPARASATAKSNENLFGFAEQLYLERDYYRAIGEYKRFRFLNPQHRQNNYVNWRIGLAYLIGGKFDLAETYLQLACTLAQGAVEKERFCFSLATLAWKRGEPKDAIDLYQHFLLHYSDPHRKARAQWRIGWIYLEEELFAAAAKAFATVPAGAKQKTAAEKLTAESLKLGEMPRLIPWRAALSSAILPGSGQLYAGRKREALAAFLIVGLAAWGSFEAFRHDQPGFGIFLSVVGGSFYLGNIFSAANASVRQNRDNLKREMEKLQSHYPLDIAGQG